MRSCLGSFFTFLLVICLLITLVGCRQTPEADPSGDPTTTAAATTTTAEGATTTTETTTTAEVTTTTTAAPTTATPTGGNGGGGGSSANSPSPHGHAWYEDPALASQNRALSAVVVKGGTAYEYYNYVSSIATSYANAVNRAAENLKGKAKVYVVLAPTSVDIMLPDNQKPSSVSDQGEAINSIHSKLSADVTAVAARKNLLAHRDEYLYFHADHHWTARGAYYAYEAFMKAAGKTPTPLSGYTEYTYTDFRGSFYSLAAEAGLQLTTDTVYAYDPPGDVSMTYRATTWGAENYYNVITNVTDWSSRYKYNTFIAGDQAMVTITNNSVTDNSAIVLIKESFGNAFAPFLAANYHKVYVIDYRYYGDSLTNVVNSTGAQTVLFMQNMSATRNSGLVSQISTLVG